MMHVYLWGAGKRLAEVYDCLDLDRCVVDGIVDRHAGNGKCFRSYVIQFPEVLEDASFDAVIVTAVHWESIAKDYETMGFPADKLICCFRGKDANNPVFQPTCLRLYQRIHELEGGIHELEGECRKWKLRVETAPFEFSGKEAVHVFDGVSLLQRILKEQDSLSRFGDGEFSTILLEKRPWFQTPDPRLAQKLRQVLDEDEPNLLLAIADNYGNLERYTDKAADEIRNYQMENQHRERILELLDPSRAYYDAYVTRPYYMYRDKSYSKTIFGLWKQIFANRDTLIVEGRFSRFGCGSDLLAGATNVRRILAPEKDAFARYEDILESVKRHANVTDLILISLGPTATVLASDVAKMGIQAIDIGQLDNEYDWYRMGTKERVPIVGKMTAEVQWDREVEEIQDTAYESSIVDCCFRRNIHE